MMIQLYYQHLFMGSPFQLWCPGGSDFGDGGAERAKAAKNRTVNNRLSIAADQFAAGLSWRPNWRSLRPVLRLCSWQYYLWPNRLENYELCLAG